MKEELGKVKIAEAMAQVESDEYKILSEELECRLRVGKPLKDENLLKDFIEIKEKVGEDINSKIEDSILNIIDSLNEILKRDYPPLYE